MTKNLISVSQLCQTNSVSVEFFPWHFEVKSLRTGAVLLQGKTEDQVYKLPLSPPFPSLNHVHSHPSINLWHHRLGHPHLQVLKRVIPSSSFLTSFSCPDCLASKSHKLPFFKSTLSSTKPLEIIFSDVWGPTSIESINGFFLLCYLY